MESGRLRLIGAARALLSEHPNREPSTRELYETAGVAAPTLYHHFGTKEGLLDAVVEEAFSAYLERKKAMPSTGDLLADFASGWDVHIEFGVQNPLLYRFMFGRSGGSRCDAAHKAETELRRGLERLAEEGLLQMDVDDAVAVTTGTAIGCVMQLVYDGGEATGFVARTMRSALIAELTEQSPQPEDVGQVAWLLLARMGSATGLFTTAEEALLRQWLRAFVEHAESATPTRSTVKGRNQ